MPDWSWQTVFRPALTRVPYPMAQSIAFRTIGLLGRFAIGRRVIAMMGHAIPPREVALQKRNRSFPGRCGLAGGVDLNSQAVSAMSLFGFGLIEVGPVATHAEQQTPSSTKWNHGALKVSTTQAPLNAEELHAALQRNAFRNDVPVVARINTVASAADLQSITEQLNSLVDGFSIRVTHDDFRNPAACAARLSPLIDTSLLTIAIVSARAIPDRSELENLLTAVGFDGLMVEARSDDCRDDQVTKSTLAESVAELTGTCEDRLLITLSDVSEPAGALELLDAGADLVMVDSGLAVAGPGLPKRINAAVRASQLAAENESHTIETDSQPHDSIPPPQRSWFWAMLLGISLTAGGLVALAVGWTRVLLPYDEAYLGMLRDEICSINSQLLPFMSHDRVTLAGTMLALGPLYLALAWYGDRRGQHWARVAILTGSFVGFLSFFLFLGFGYFDPFHAFISAVLFQFTTLGLRSNQPRITVPEFDLRNSASWRRALWGQLLMVLHGAAILTGGAVICSFGVTTVFVADDLEFLQTSRDVLVAANPRLVPLVAHDRASFGGMLMATGITVLLSCLWGWQRGRRWLWWALTGAGTVAYGLTLLIHWQVGYTSLVHLLPAYGGLVVLWIAMSLCRAWFFEDASVRD